MTATAINQKVISSLVEVVLLALKLNGYGFFLIQNIEAIHYANVFVYSIFVYSRL